MSRSHLGICLAAVVAGSLGCGGAEHSRTPAAGQASRPRQPRVQVLASVDGVTVLRYEGDTLDAALAAGNREKASKLLADNVLVDEKRPLFGTLTVRIDINETRGGGGASSSGHSYESPVELVLTRKSEGAVEWEATPEAVATIKRVKEE